ncbi:MAG: MFS transporter [Alphaproteobacteria bacterium]|nr:MFS transporter [Alphaproteobacteria bacterium]MBU0875875.1 MFS transporter [Alphaproteobacteria bacterium]MBU1769944.1 MFS transporter [Alphaproteobacteria bacterium]
MPLHLSTSVDHVDANDWRAVLSAILLGTVGVLSFIIQPGLVQGYVTQLNVSEADAVYLAGIEMLGVALATIFMALKGVRLDWRWIIVSGLSLAVIGNIGSALTLSNDAFSAFRLLSGVGEGIIISISFTFVGLTTKAERNLSLYLVSLLTYGAFGLWYLPAFLAAFGLTGLFLGFAACSAAAMVTAAFVPRAFSISAMPNPEARQLPRVLLAVALLGVLSYNVAQGIAWAILFLLGVDAGLAEQSVANALFLSQVLAIAGALAAVFLAARINRNFAIGFGILAGGASIAILLDHPSLALFTLGVCGFNVLWNFVLPFILGRICDFEESGRMMSFAIAVQMIGLGSGPLVAAALLERSGYRATGLVCVALFVLSYLLLLIPIRRHGALLARAQTV